MFHQMASASKESLTSVRSMLLAPSFGVLSMSVCQLVQYLQSKHWLSKAIGYNYVSVSIGGLEPYVHCSPAAARPHRELALIGLSGGGCIEFVFYVLRYAGTR